MPKVDFTCLKCHKKATANVPASGARVECPACGAGVNVVPPKAKPAPKPAFEVVEDDEPSPQTAKSKPKKPKKTAKAVVIDDSNKRLWAWIGGGVAILLVTLASVLVLSRNRDGEVADNRQQETPLVPPVNTPPNGNPPIHQPKVEPPKKDGNTPKVEPPKVNPPKVEPTPSGELDKDWPVLPPRKRQVVAFDAPSVTRVRWYSSRDNTPPMVALEQPQDPFPQGLVVHRGALANEIARQAFALTVREEFAGTTRDTLLREKFDVLATHQLTHTFELTWVTIPGQHAAASIFVVEGDARRQIWKCEIPLPNKDLVDYAAIATQLEQATRGELATTLAKETKSKRVAVPNSNIASPPEVEKALNAVSYFEAFAVIRRLHTLNRNPSAVLCRDLSRGYAQLALLTEHLRLPSDAVFKARAILYSHRALSLGDATGKWAVAYASCLVGVHYQAIEQAKAADANNRPGWAKVIEPVCRYDHIVLGELAKDSHYGPMAEVLRFLAVKNPPARTLAIGYGIEVLKHTKECSRVATHIRAISQFGIETTLTNEANATLSVAIADQLAKWQDLPQTARELLPKVRTQNMVAERDMLRALEATSGPTELSFSVLTSLIREQRSIDLVYTLSYLERRWSAPQPVIEEALKKVLPALEDHPKHADYSKLIITRPTIPQQQPVRDYEREFPEEAIYGTLAVESAVLARLDHTDSAFNEIRHKISKTQSDWFTTKLLKISSHSPTARLVIIDHDWARAVAETKQWESEFAKHPVVLMSLAQKYLDAKEYATSERLYLAAIKVSPDNLSYLRLADVYERVHKDEKKKLAFMEERLTRPDYQTERANMRLAIAEFYARKSDFKTALRYAERAAEETNGNVAIQKTVNYALKAGETNKAALWDKRFRELYGR